jgi:anti-anti-sigma factor
VAEFITKKPQDAADARISLLEVSGSFDVATLNSFNESIALLIEKGQVFVIMNLENVDFIGSPAVGAMMGAKRRLVEKSGNLVIVGLSHELKQKLNLMGANRIFRFYTDVKSVLTDYYWEYDEEPQEMTLRIPSKPTYVPPLRRLISNIVLSKGYSRKDAFRIETIMDELANNAIEHSDPSQQKFYIDFFVDKEKVEVVVRNKTKGLRPQDLDTVIEKFNHPEVDDTSIRGRGLALVKMLSSELKVDIDEDGTLVHVTKLREE